MALFSLGMVVLDPTDWTGWLLILAPCGGLAAALLFVLPREVIFDEAITVRRYLFPDRLIPYGDVTDIGIGRLKSRKGRLAWSGATNSYTFDAILSGLIRRGKIRESQLEGKIFVDDMAGLYAVGIGWVVAPVVLWFLRSEAVQSAWYTKLPEWAQDPGMPFSVACATLLVYFPIRYWWLGDHRHNQRQHRTLPRR